MDGKTPPARADIRVGGAKLVLGLEYVGAPQEHAGIDRRRQPLQHDDGSPTPAGNRSSSTDAPTTRSKALRSWATWVVRRATSNLACWTMVCAWLISS